MEKSPPCFATLWLRSYANYGENPLFRNTQHQGGFLHRNPTDYSNCLQFMRNQDHGKLLWRHWLESERERLATQQSTETELCCGYNADL